MSDVDLPAGDEIDPENPQRTAAAEQLRRLVHSLVGHDADDDALREIAARASDLADRVEGAPVRQRPEALLRRFEEPVGEGAELTCWNDCVVAGASHPYATGFRGERRGDEVVAWVTLGPAHEGAPGRSHGGIIAALFDEAMGFALWMDGQMAYTAWLTTNFVAPAPIGTELEFRSRVTSTEGRKMFLEATASDGDTVIGTAEALFIAVPADHLG